MSQTLFTEAPRQEITTGGSEHRLITFPFKDEEGCWIGLRVEDAFNEADGTTIHLSREQAQRLARNLMLALQPEFAHDVLLDFDENRFFG